MKRIIWNSAILSISTQRCCFFKQLFDSCHLNYVQFDFYLRNRFTSEQCLHIYQEGEPFNERIISARISMTWPTESCDWIPCSYFLWGYDKAAKSTWLANKYGPITSPALNPRRTVTCILCRYIIHTNHTKAVDSHRGYSTKKVYFCLSPISFSCCVNWVLFGYWLQ